MQYLGFRFSLTGTGAVIRRLKTASKLKYKRRLRLYEQLYKEDKNELKEIEQSLAGFHGHMKHASTYSLRKKALGEFILTKGN